MARKKMLVRIAEVTQDGGIAIIRVVAQSNIEARGLVIRFLGDKLWKSIRVRDTPDRDPGPARVLTEE